MFLSNATGSDVVLFLHPKEDSVQEILCVPKSLNHTNTKPISCFFFWLFVCSLSFRIMMCVWVCVCGAMRVPPGFTTQSMGFVALCHADRTRTIRPLSILPPGLVGTHVANVFPTATNLFFPSLLHRDKWPHRRTNSTSHQFAIFDAGRGKERREDSQHSFILLEINTTGFCVWNLV